jgi:hypothetical protein
MRLVEDVGREGLPDLEKALSKIYRSGIRAGLRDVALPEQTPLGLTDAFAQERAGQIAMRLGIEQQTLLTSLLRQPRDVNYTPRDLAEILHGTLGLNSRLLNAVLRYRDGLVGDFARRDANRMANTYARTLLRYRLNMTAATEAAIAKNAGRESAWGAAQLQGYLMANAERAWICVRDEYLCKLCRPLHGVVVRLGQPWELPNGARIYTPGMAHPHCRCEERLVINGIQIEEAA